MNFEKDLKLLEIRQRGEYALKHELEFESKKDGFEKLKNDIANYKKMLVSFEESNRELNTEQTIERIEKVRVDVLKMFNQLIDIQTTLGRLETVLHREDQ